jgi:hypothetical protein
MKASQRFGDWAGLLALFLAAAASAEPANSSLMMRSVGIQNSPGVPDTGGHCIICGLLTGNLKAVGTESGDLRHSDGHDRRAQTMHGSLLAGARLHDKSWPASAA